MAKNKTPKTNKERRDWLIANSEKLVEVTFKNLEDNFKQIENDYKNVYHEIATKLVKLTEGTIADGKVSNPILFQNKFVQLVQQTVGKLTSLDNLHGELLNEVMGNYHETISNYQYNILKIAREDGILFREKEINEEALKQAINFPYQDYPFVSYLNKGTVKVGEKLNIILANKIIEGTSVAKIINQVEDAFNIKRNEAERIARTETSRVLNNASLNIYKGAGLEQVKWLDSTEAIKGSTIKKAKVCGDCRKVATHNKGIYPINEVPHLPLHPHCRCTITPVVEEILDSVKPKEQPKPLAIQGSNLEFKNVKEANQYLEDKLGLKSNLKGTIDKSHLNSLVNITTDMFKEFPALEKSMLGVGWESGKAIAWFEWAYSGKTGKNLIGNLVLTPKYFKKGGLYDPTPTVKNTGWHIKNTGKYNDGEITIFHEFGHAIHNVLGQKLAGKGDNGFAKDMDAVRIAVDKHLKETKEKAFAQLGINTPEEYYKYALLNISKYSTTNDKELFAECFADVKANGEEADAFSKLFVGDILGLIKE